MKSIIFTLTMLLGFFASAQYSWTEATISLHDGTTLNGEARLLKKGSGFNTTSRTVQYRADKDSEKIKYQAEDVERIIFKSSYTSQDDNGALNEITSYDTFKAVDVKKYRYVVFLQEIIEDKLSLYGFPAKNYKSRISSNDFPYNLGKFNVVYIKKEDTSARQVTVLGLEGFIQDKKVAEYLSDCPLMLEYIKSYDGSVTAVDVVTHYNKNCK